MNQTAQSQMLSPARSHQEVRLVPQTAIHPGTGIEVPSDLVDLLNLTPEDFEFFQRWGYRKLAVQMLVNEAKTLAQDPERKTEEGRRSHHWVASGDTGVLPFDTCLVWAGLYDYDGNYLDDRIRAEILQRPQAIVNALTKVESVIDAHEQRESAASLDVAPMTLAQRIDFVYPDDSGDEEEACVESAGDYPGAPMFVDFHARQMCFDRPGRGME